ncbi:MAG TPA: SDR family oxidoreductase [Nannocystaceae bacterium]|nr:SDR family oxidoreductase [Nannocystaceae bacterium]
MRRNNGGWWLGAAGALAAAWAFHRRQRAFAGKLAVITGGSRGLGLVLARALAKRGAVVVILARDERELERAATHVARTRAEIYYRICDVTDRADVAATIADIELEHGAIDLLVNNAGILHVGPATAMTVADLRAAMDTNFWGAVNTVDAVLPSMVARHSGHIVNVASIGGVVPVPWMLPYSASKSALMGWSNGLHHDLAREGIDVTTVAPWVMRTGGPINSTYKGSRRRLLYTLFAIADITPVLSVDPATAAAAILRGIAARRAVVFVGVQARLLAIMNALTPGLVAGAFAFAAKLLPRSFTHAGTRGRELARELGPIARRIAERSRSRNNQPQLDESPDIHAEAFDADAIARAAAS